MAALVYSIADEIKARLPILEAVQSLIPVERLTFRGSRATGLCPLHSEKTPSFVVYLDQNRFYCFGCHAHGDQITLYAAYKGMTNSEAIRELAEYLGLSRNLSSAGRANAEQEARKREQEKLLENKLEARIGEVTHVLADEMRAMERYLLVIRDAGKDPLQDSLCCDWLRKRDLIEYWLDQLTFGDAEAKIQALLEVLQWLDL